jgi:hypothetical protein
MQQWARWVWNVRIGCHARGGEGRARTYVSRWAWVRAWRWGIGAGGGVQIVCENVKQFRIECKHGLALEGMALRGFDCDATSFRLLTQQTLSHAAERAMCKLPPHLACYPVLSVLCCAVRMKLLVGGFFR